MPLKRTLQFAVAMASSVVLGFLCRNNSPLPLRISSGRFPAIEASKSQTESLEIAARLAASTDDHSVVTRSDLSALREQTSAVEVYVFLSPHCPISNSYVPMLNHLIHEFSSSDF